jgi:hypothetical protein
MRRSPLSPRLTAVGLAAVLTTLLGAPSALLAQETPAPDATPPEAEALQTPAEPDVAEESKAPSEDEESVAAQTTGESEGVPEAETPTEASPDGAPPEVGEALPPSDLPAEGMTVPAYAPPPPDGADAAAGEEEQAVIHEEGDNIRYSGYLPGYRRHFEFGQDPLTPRVGSLPGGMTPGYGAPVPPSEWIFSFNGFMNVSMEASLDKRMDPAEGQAEGVTNVKPRTLDTYDYFTSVNAVPGNWVSMRFRYGTSKVSANFSFDTYNISNPASFYQMGAQFFINNAYMEYNPSRLGDLGFKFKAGRHNLSYGQLAQYGSGMYTHAITAKVQGVGLTTEVDYPIDGKWELVGEHNIMTSRDGTIPENVVRDANNGWRRPLWAGSLINGLHLGFNVKSEPRIEFRVRQLIDDISTRSVDERAVKDAKFNIYGADFKILDPTFGVLGLGASYTLSSNVFPLRGVYAYGGNGEEFTERYIGQPSMGNGDVLVLATNYSASLGNIISYPAKFDGNGRDLRLNTAFQYVRIGSDYDGFDGKQRYKMGLDLEYAFFKYMSIAGRVDRVIPDSRENDQSFTVLAPRLMFRTGWWSRMNFQVMYAKWFFGTTTRNEGSGERSPEALDDEMFAVNMNMWW